MQEQQVQTQEVKKASKLHIASYILNVVLLITVAVLIVMLVKPEGGFSSILGGGIDMRERVGEPQNFSFKYDAKFYMHGKAENLSGKTIKYCTFEVIGYNAVGDKITSDTFKVTGPIEPGELIDFELDNGSSMGGIWWFEIEGVKKVEIGKITLEYMDGTTETGYYGHSKEKK